VGFHNSNKTDAAPEAAHMMDIAPASWLMRRFELPLIP
jgi:hypothetical protein